MILQVFTRDDHTVYWNSGFSLGDLQYMLWRNHFGFWYLCGFKIYVILQRHVAFDNYRLAQEYLSCINGEEMGKKICTKIYLFAFKNSNII